jgi:hypothetical protein
MFTKTTDRDVKANGTLLTEDELSFISPYCPISFRAWSI